GVSIPDNPGTAPKSVRKRTHRIRLPPPGTDPTNGGNRMRRTRMMVPLAALAALVLPVPALAGGPGPQNPSTPRTAPCSPIPVPNGGDAAAVGSGRCPGVRPGGRVLTQIGDCTFNFLFRAPDGTRYMGTAGHCV